MYKKGVSPLIATVLLLAFAVALATVIIQLEPFSKCVLKDSEIRKDATGAQRVCFNNKTGKVEVFVFNGDKRPITGFKVSVSGEMEPLNIGRIPIEIGEKEEGKLIFAYDFEKHGKINGLDIYPQINKSSKIQECNIKEDILKVPNCAQ